MDKRSELKETGRQGRKKLKKKKRNRTIIIIVLILFAVFFSRVKSIMDLKSEQVKLSKQQEELKKERDPLKAKLKNIDSKDYIQEQARKQLKMMDPDEILYVFEDDKKSGKDKN